MLTSPRGRLGAGGRLKSCFMEDGLEEGGEVSNDVEAFAEPLAHDFRQSVQDERHGEENEAAQEADAVVGGVLRRLRQFRGDVGGEGAHAVEDVPVLDRGVPRGHQHDHGFPHGSAQTYHQGGEDARGSHRKDHGADHLPAAGPQRLRGGDKGRGDVAQGIRGNGEDDGEETADCLIVKCEHYL